ncbi:phosphatase PAP2 family protein [Dyella jiangningensis]|uniref:undecaprenyl-diphosphate phosphatase n=1 Tax=Dyella jiangningensis TaxID=1379159 RepID=A0A328NYE8_9GAMM|nr:phosphatase PAP2 family protein [Dyella jiangningensis]RAO75167.1 phosphoesterase PA-phosphatase [Dyella jiangningensis]
MNDPVEWIATHALALWAALLLLACLAGDIAWQWNRRQRETALRLGHEPTMIRARTVVTLSIAALLLFAALALALGMEAGLSRFDTALAEDLRARMQPSTLSVVAFVSHFGDLGSVATATVLVLAVLLLRRQPQLATCWAIAMAGIVPLNSGLKALFQRPRPLHSHGFIVEHGWSFPSGHAFGAIVFYGMLAYVLLRLSAHRWHRLVVALAVAMVTVIGLSRIVLQVHYFSDVMAGYASGLVWLVLCIAGTEAWRRRHPAL